MRYDFDRLVERRGTASVKWDYQQEYTGTSGLLPLWVADMEFPAPPEIMEAIRRRVEHGVFGYVREPESYFEAARQWLVRRHGWAVRREWMVACPGVVPAISTAILALTEPGDGIVIQPPVYHPFGIRIRANGRRVVENPLVLRDGRWSMDLEGLERVLDGTTRLLILCSPHNPVARVWDRGTLEGLSAICRERGVRIVSDEIHADLVMKGHRHVPLASVSEEAGLAVVTLVAATKTFNLAGLGGSLAIVASEELRRKFDATQHAVAGGAPNAIAVAASEAAWLHGEPWLEELLDYLEGSYEMVRGFLADRMPKVRLFPLEGTYLPLMDFRGCGLDDGALRRRLLHEARVWLDEGTKFGRGAEGMQRLNLACPRSVLREGLDRMERAFRDL